MGIRWDRAYPELKALAERIGAPVFCTPKAKGALPENHAYSAGVCNGSSQASRAVAADTACAGGYPGVFYMSGNVEEWQDACSAQSGPSDACGLQGGDWEDTRSGLDCAGSARTDNRSYAWKSRGIRCCSDP